MTRREIEVDVSTLAIYETRTSREGPEIPLDRSALSTAAWRIAPRDRRSTSSQLPLALQEGVPDLRVPDGLPPGCRVLRTDNFWVRCEGLPQSVWVKRARLECPADVLSDPSRLGAWAAAFEEFRPGPEASGDQPIRISRTTNFVCVAEIDDAGSVAESAGGWLRVAPVAWRRQLAPPNSEFWIVNTSQSDQAGRKKLDAATVLYLFVLASLKERLLRDAIRESLKILGPTEPDPNVATRQLGGDANRLRAMQVHRLFLLAKLRFDPLGIEKWSDQDGPVYRSMLELSGTERLLKERERDFEAIADLVSGASLHRETSLIARLIAGLGLLAACAGVLQAVDRTDVTLPLSTGPSVIRGIILVGFGVLLALVALLASVLIGKRTPRR